ACGEQEAAEERTFQCAERAAAAAIEIDALQSVSTGETNRPTIRRPEGQRRIARVGKRLCAAASEWPYPQLRCGACGRGGKHDLRAIRRNGCRRRERLPE